MLYDNNALKNQQLELDEAALKELAAMLDAIPNKEEGVCGFVLTVEGGEVVDGVIRGITRLGDREGTGKTGKWVLQSVRIDFESVEGIRYNVYLSEFKGANKVGEALARILRTAYNNAEAFKTIAERMHNLCLDTMIDRINSIIGFAEKREKPTYLATTLMGEVSEKEIVTAKGTIVKSYVNPKVYTFGYRKAEKAEEVTEA